MIQKTIRRFGFLLSFVLAGLLVTSAATTKTVARTHRTGRHGKSMMAHSRVSHHRYASVRHISAHRKTRHNAYRERRMNARHYHYALARHSRHSARISHFHKTPQRALTTAEKTEIVQKIREIASDQPATIGLHVQSPKVSPSLNLDDSVLTAEKNSADIQSQIAAAAKEEEAEDGVDASLDQYFKSRPGATDTQSVAMQTALDPASVAEALPDITLFDENDPSRATQRSDVMAEIINWIGTRYEFGGVDRSGIDCSAFTQKVFEKSFGIDLPRTAYAQSQMGDPVQKSALQFGDLVFFRTARYAPITHVGIYIGEGLFANAACSRGVTVASLGSEYWSKHYVEARRFVSNSGMASVTSNGSSAAMAVGGN